MRESLERIYSRGKAEVNYRIGRPPLTGVYAEQISGREPFYGGREDSIEPELFSLDLLSKREQLARLEIPYGKEGFWGHFVNRNQTLFFLSDRQVGEVQIDRESIEGGTIISCSDEIQYEREGISPYSLVVPSSIELTRHFPEEIEENIGQGDYTIRQRDAAVFESSIKANESFSTLNNDIAENKEIIIRSQGLTISFVRSEKKLEIEPVFMSNVEIGSEYSILENSFAARTACNTLLKEVYVLDGGDLSSVDCLKDLGLLHKCWTHGFDPSVKGSNHLEYLLEDNPSLHSIAFLGWYLQENLNAEKEYEHIRGFDAYAYHSDRIHEILNKMHNNIETPESIRAIYTKMISDENRTEYIRSLERILECLGFVKDIARLRKVECEKSSVVTVLDESGVYEFKIQKEYGCIKGVYAGEGGNGSGKSSLLETLGIIPIPVAHPNSDPVRNLFDRYLATREQHEELYSLQRDIYHAKQDLPERLSELQLLWRNLRTLIRKVITDVDDNLKTGKLMLNMLVFDRSFMTAPIFTSNILSMIRGFHEELSSGKTLMPEKIFVLQTPISAAVQRLSKREGGRLF